MKYILLIYSNQKERANWSEAQLKQEYDDYMVFGSDNEKLGIEAEGEALMPTDTATTVRLRDGQTVTTDGPFAETHEQLGGYYVVDAKDLDEAIAVAARIPSAKYGGSIEIRPLMVFG